VLPLELVLVYMDTGELRRAGDLGTGCCLDATQQVVLVVLGLLVLLMVLGLLVLGLLLLWLQVVLVVLGLLVLQLMLGLLLLGL